MATHHLATDATLSPPLVYWSTDAHHGWSAMEVTGERRRISHGSIRSLVSPSSINEGTSRGAGGWTVAARAKRWQRGVGRGGEEREEWWLGFVGVRVGFTKNGGLFCKHPTKLLARLAPCSVLGRELGDVASRGGPREP